MEPSQQSYKADSLHADKHELVAFFSTLFRNAKEGHISLRGFSNNRGVAFIESYHFTDPLLPLAFERLATFAANQDNVVFCSPIATFQDNKNACDQNMANGLTVSVDLDQTNPQKSRELLEGLLGPATAVIASGGQWLDINTGETHPKLHLHWRLGEPTDNAEKHKQLKRVRKMAAELVEGDPSGAPPAHPYRWPGSWHTKSEPKMCRITEVREDAEIRLEEAEALLNGELRGPETYREENQYALPFETSGPSFEKAT